MSKKLFEKLRKKGRDEEADIIERRLRKYTTPQPSNNRNGNNKRKEKKKK